MTRRGLVAALVMLALAAGCGSDEPEPSETIEIFGPYRGDAARWFSESLDAFADANDVRVRYTGSSDFVNDLRQRVNDSDAPDIAVVPQPGLVRRFYEDEQLVPLSPEVVEAIDRNYAEVAQDLGNIDEVHVGVVYRAAVKSLVWYRPSVFESFGYSTPKTLAELEQLVSRAQADGIAPWCLTIQARGATGWVGTDWVEDLLVRRHGPELYNDWAAGELEFIDDRVAAAFTEFRELALDRGRVFGGLERVLREPVQIADDPLFSHPAGCLLHRQASFASDWFPDGVRYGDPDGDLEVFVFPGVDPEADVPLLLGGDLAVGFNTRPVVQDMLAYLATPASASVWHAEGSFFSPRVGQTADELRDPLADLQADLIEATDVVVFDGSDQMPPSIGSELFWAEVTAWIAGERPYAALADTMDSAFERWKALTDPS